MKQAKLKFKNLNKEGRIAKVSTENTFVAFRKYGFSNFRKLLMPNQLNPYVWRAETWPSEIRLLFWL